MFKRVSQTICAGGIALLAYAGVMTTPVAAAGGGGDIIDHEWTFDGPFGYFDKASLQRGFQVYREVCASCHGLNI